MWKKEKAREIESANAKEKQKKTISSPTICNLQLFLLIKGLLKMIHERLLWFEECKNPPEDF